MVMKYKINEDTIPFHYRQQDKESIMSHIDEKKIKQGVKLILEGIGEDPNSFLEVLSGTHKDPDEFAKLLTEEKHDEMVILKNIPIYSICEHHFLPFSGTASIVYIPRQGRIMGLNSIAYLVDTLSRRLQIQERLTKQVADYLVKTLTPLGAMVVIKAEHLCMTMRGVKKPGSITVTSAVRGIFRNKLASRQEAMSLIMNREH